MRTSVIVIASGIGGGLFAPSSALAVDGALLDPEALRSESAATAEPIELDLLVAPGEAGEEEGERPLRALWREQLLGVCAIDGEGDAAPTRAEYALQALSLPWKLLVAAACPPAGWRGGVPTFFATLLLVGACTTVISDLASILGCILAIPDPTTAVTLVAIGTSVPDTFASMIAAVNEPTADASITNVMGSNSANVFLGLGLPWTFAALYWAAAGPTDSWAAAYPDVAARMEPGVAVYVVYGGDLGFSVGMFVLVSLVGTCVLLWRRFALGAELGGDRELKWKSAAGFVGMWVAYTLVVCGKFAGAY